MPSTSDVWKFFTKLDGGKQCKCNLCGKVCAYHGGTTNLREHLVAAHSREYCPDSKEMQQPKITTMFRPATEPNRMKKITELLIGMICRDMRPISIANGSGFRDLLNFIEPGYQIPSPPFLKNAIGKMHEEERKRLKVYLQTVVPVLALTTDGWTSCANEAFITITGHFITGDWRLVSVVLQITKMEERHTSENLAEYMVSSLIDDWGLKKESICAIVHDNAANMVKMQELLTTTFGCPSWCSVSCTAHSLQLAINKGLKSAEISDMLGACRKQRHSRHSSTATAELHKEQSWCNSESE